MEDDPRLVISIPEAAPLLGISRTLAYELAARGELPVIKLGRRRMVSRRWLGRMVDQGRPSDPAA